MARGDFFDVDNVAGSASLLDRICPSRATVAVINMAYTGLPLAVAGGYAGTTVHRSDRVVPAPEAACGRRIDHLSRHNGERRPPHALTNGARRRPRRPVGLFPERGDPRNLDFSTTRIPKVVGADDPASRDAAEAFYRHIAPAVVPVSSAATAEAEAVKLTEKLFRAVNIGLVNELKLVYGAMGIDVWKVIDAVKTKPFGYMPFYPGAGLGGHCIPIDPFYLTWKAREYDQHTRFIELAGQIKSAMREHVVRVLLDALDARRQRGLTGARVLVVGLAYKKNVDDFRESPSLELMELIEARGARADFHDPHVARINDTRDHPSLNFREGVPFDPHLIGAYDAMLVATDHDAVDYVTLVDAAKLVVDTRNARAGADMTKVVRA